MMNKDEILERSRKQKEDEGIAFIENKGMSYGVIGMSVMFFSLAIIFIFVGGDNLSVPFAMMTAYQGAENIGKYSAGREKKDLVWGIILSITAVVFLMSYLLIDVLGVIVF